MSNEERSSRRDFLMKITGASGVAGAMAFVPVGVALTADPVVASAQPAPAPASAAATPTEIIAYLKSL